MRCSPGVKVTQRNVDAGVIVFGAAKCFLDLGHLLSVLRLLPLGT